MNEKGKTAEKVRDSREMFRPFKDAFLMKRK